MNILIAGYGWLGKYLVDLAQEQGHQIAVVTRSLEKAENFRKSKKLPVVLCASSQYFIPDQLPFVPDVVVLCIPPAKDPESYNNWCLYFLGISAYLEQNQIHPHWIYTSSTGIYPDVDGYFDEDFLITPQNTKQLYLLMHEQILSNQIKSKCAIVRLGGLLGGSRNPIRFYHQNAERFNANEPVNMIHGSDAARFILFVASKKIDGIWNVCSPEHPERYALYKEACIKQGIEPNNMKMVESPKLRIINTTKLKALDEFSFKHENLLQLDY